MKSISFKIKSYGDIFTVDFDKISISDLCVITRILDIENHDSPLNIEVGYELFIEIKNFLYNEHWMINHDFLNKDPDVLSIKLNGFELIFKHKNKT